MNPGRPAIVFSHSTIRVLSFVSIFVAASAGMLLMDATDAWAGQNLETSDYLRQVLTIDNERQALKARNEKPPGTGIIPPGQPEAPASVGAGGSNNIALLPIIGYDPTSGLMFGGQFNYIGLGKSNANLEIGATHSTAGDTSLDFALSEPYLFNSRRLIGLIKFTHDHEPSVSFYGLGNNNAGNSGLSTHERRETQLLFTLGYRLAPHWVAAIGAGLDNVKISRGQRSGNTPFTLLRFPNLPGIHGGYNNPVAVSLLYNTQYDLTRPEQGWNNILKIQHVGPELGNRVNYTRYLADFQYRLPVVSAKNILAFRLDGEYVSGRGNNLPFYEMPYIGGGKNLEGFNSDRFRGQSRVFAQVAYHRLLADFNFYNIWRVRIGGVLFGGLGRVFLNRSKLPPNLSKAATPGLSNKIRYSYGTGARIALGESLVARIDVGFSQESKGQVFLEFGNRF